MALTLFSWGYWGWGNANEQLVESFDLAEIARGFEPPVFIDCRIKRQGRAKGFVGDAFREQVGGARYCWMQDLGNDAVAKGLSGVQIKNPAAVADLLQLGSQAAKEWRRVIFYCACEFQWGEGELKRNRYEITTLLMAHAQKQGSQVTVVEWPGGNPAEVRLKVDHKLFSAVMRGRMSIPFDRDRLSEFAGLPWGSLVALDCESGGTARYAIVGPARFATSKGGDGYWFLPVIEPPGPGISKEMPFRHAARWRTAHGLDERSSS